MRRPAASLLLAALACSGIRLGGGPRYAKTAEENYTLGLKEFGSQDWGEAQRYFEHVKNRYPFSAYAALAELRIADIRFEQDRLPEATESYQQFVKLHPTHAEVDYAAYRAALSRWRNGPSDFLLFPPSYEKDLAEVRAAVTAYEAFLAAHPRSKYAEQARRELGEARDRLAEHEWYVAQFYRKRNRWAGAAQRLEGLVREYPGTRRETEALLQLADTYLKLNERFRAQQALQQLIVKHPQDPRRAEAEKLLAQLR